MSQQNVCPRCGLRAVLYERDYTTHSWLCFACGWEKHTPRYADTSAAETAAVVAAIVAEGPLPRGPKPRVRVAS